MKTTPDAAEPVAVMVDAADGEGWFPAVVRLGCWRCGGVLGARFADVRDRRGHLVRVCPGCVTSEESQRARRGLHQPS